jgi:hypothetical protein
MALSVTPDVTKRFRDRAEEIRARAVDMNHPAARATMIGIANSYEGTAAQFERHNSGDTQGGLH